MLYLSFWYQQFIFRFVLKDCPAGCKGTKSRAGIPRRCFARTLAKGRHHSHLCGANADSTGTCWNKILQNSQLLLKSLQMPFYYWPSSGSPYKQVQSQRWPAGLLWFSQCIFCEPVLVVQQMLSEPIVNHRATLKKIPGMPINLSCHPCRLW